MYKFQVTQLDWAENPWFQNWKNIKVVDTWENVSSDLPVIIGSNLLKYRSTPVVEKLLNLQFT
jgi:hypothetical protein